jgi:hypothetical protein
MKRNPKSKDPSSREVRGEKVGEGEIEDADDDDYEGICREDAGQHIGDMTKV